MHYIHKFTVNKPISELTKDFWVGSHVCWNEATGECFITNISTGQIRLESSEGMNDPSLVNIFTTAKDYPLYGTLVDNTLTIDISKGDEIGFVFNSSLDTDTNTLIFKLESAAAAVSEPGGEEDE